jgi:hypothetical protein
MARYKDYSYEQAKLIPLSFHHQIRPGSFEYALSHIVDNEIDLSIFESRYVNEETGAPAFDPAILLKIVLYAHSRGIDTVRIITDSQRMRRIAMNFKEWCKAHRDKRMAWIMGMVKTKLNGLKNYFGVVGNSKRVRQIYNIFRYTL